MTDRVRPAERELAPASVPFQRMHTMSHKAQVIADNSGIWAGNSLRFDTAAEAQAWVHNLAHRWTAVIQTRVVESTEPVNCSYIDGVLTDVDPASNSQPQTEKPDAIAPTEIPANT